MARRKNYSPELRNSEGRKNCTLCREWLAESEFTRAAGYSDGLFGMCKVCKRSVKHGLTRTTYLEILEGQGGGCAICKDTEDLVIDHDHSHCLGDTSCGSCVRGILCRLCNVALGQFQDDIELVRSAVAYLDAGRYPKS